MGSSILAGILICRHSVSICCKLDDGSIFALCQDLQRAGHSVSHIRSSREYRTA